MRIPILGVGFDNLTMDEALERAEELMQERRGAYVATPNPEIVMACRSDREALEAVNGAALVIPDGIGIIYGAKILGTPLRERVPGIELTTALLERLAAAGGSVYLFGSRPGVAETAGEKLSERFPGLVIAGTDDGFFADDGPIVERIRAATPDLLLVCLGAPKQEKWMRAHTDLPVRLMIGAGGSLDVFAGVARRAPAIFCKLGLEWFYRLLKEPWRLGRMMQLPKFLFVVIGRRLRGKNDAR